MKKRILYLLTLALFFTNSFIGIQAKENTRILISIKDAQDLYLVDINHDTLTVKTISNKLYTNIACLNAEKSTLQSVDFSMSYPCLINSVETALNTKIDHFVSIDMKAVLKKLDIKDNVYDYKTLKSLTKVSRIIKDHLKISLITNYKKYIETDLGLQDLYDLYHFFTKNHKTTKYYYLNYFIYNNKYLLFDTTFHLQKERK